MRNAYKILLDLLPSAPLQVGTIQSTENGVAVIAVPGGGLCTARGPGAVGDRVFFRDEVIEGPAPSLSVEVISV